MEDLRHTAYAYYEAGMEHLEEPVKLFFEEMERDGDEKVWFEEFNSYMKAVDCAQFGTKYFFDVLRGDKKEFLSYGDVVTLFYIIHSGRPFCEKCKGFVQGTYFTCVQCFEAESDYSFNVCPSCFYARSYHHCHKEFMDPFVLLRLKKKQDHCKESTLGHTKAQLMASNPGISSSQTVETEPSSSKAIVAVRNPQHKTCSLKKKKKKKGRKEIQLIHMAAVEVQHSGHGGNSVNEPVSMVDPAEAFFRDLVNKIRRDLPSALDFALTRDRFGWFQEFERLRNMATLYDRGLFSRAVTESCNEKYGDDSIIRNLVLRLLLPSENYLTILIKESLNNYSLTSATEVICSLRSSEIPRIKGCYSSQLGRELKDGIENFTFGEHRKLLLKYIRVASAPERNDLRAEMLRDECCEEILRSLNKNVIETFKCPRMAIGNCVFGLREEHMRAVVDGYHKKYGRPLEKDLTLANYGHSEHALVTKIKCAVNRPGYYAEKLCEAMIDRYTRSMRDIDQIDRETIVRVITTVAEIDMKMMKEEYRQKSGRALQDDISDAFLDRQDCLLLILLILNPH